MNDSLYNSAGTGMFPQGEYSLQHNFLNITKTSLKSELHNFWRLPFLFCDKEMATNLIENTTNKMISIINDIIEHLSFHVIQYYVPALW